MTKTNQTNQTNKQKTTKKQENIPKRRQYFKEKVLVPPICLRQVDDQLCNILSFVTVQTLSVIMQCKSII